MECVNHLGVIDVGSRRNHQQKLVRFEQVTSANRKKHLRLHTFNIASTHMESDTNQLKEI